MSPARRKGKQEQMTPAAPAPYKHSHKHSTNSGDNLRENCITPARHTRVKTRRTPYIWRCACDMRQVNSGTDALCAHIKRRGAAKAASLFIRQRDLGHFIYVVNCSARCYSLVRLKH